MSEEMPNEGQKRLKRHHLSPLIVTHPGNDAGVQNQAKTAPVLQDTDAVRTLRIAIEESTHQPVTRTYSLSRPRRGSEVPYQRPKLNRQKTLSGDSNASNGYFGSHVFMRTFSRNPDVVSSASSSITKEEWLRLFDRYDMENNGQVNGKIPVRDFEKILEENVLWVEKVPPDVRAHIIANADIDGDGMISQEEFLALANGKNIPGFNRRRRRALRELLKQTVEFIVPYKYQYQNQYSCFPPPIFMLTISLLQLVIFAYNSYIGGIGLNGPVFHCSRLIFDPDKRHELWRYLTYMLIHSGLFHAIFNILIQLVLGIPLEMVHGWWRVMMVYFSGVCAGSLWTSVIKPDKFLAGASGGVYALITAHLGTVIMNYREMVLPWCRVVIVFIVAASDISVFIYDIYVANKKQVPIGYAAHISGAIAGLLVGILCLRNLRWERHEKYIWVASACIFVILIGSAIIYSVAFPAHFVGIRHVLNITCIPGDII